MTTAADAADLHEARALRLVLATIRADEDTEPAMLPSQMVFNEINSIDEMDHVMGVRAALVAEVTIADSARKAAREVEKRLGFLLDFAARRALDGDD